jgi:glutathionylspermidine synthase
MRRHKAQPRANLKARIAELGFDFHTPDGQPYWDESAYYSFSLREIEEGFEAPANELAALALQLVDKAARDSAIMQRLKIPPHAWDLIAESWKHKDPSLYGRFDFSYDGQGPVKLLEYNADTPTSLYEAAVFQWSWLEDAMAQKLIASGADQFNSLHEALVARLGEIGPLISPTPVPFHVAGMADTAEDRGFLDYLADCALQAGYEVKRLGMADIGDKHSGPFVDLDDQPISLLFKLYPWEWMFADAFSKSPSMKITRFIEPPWKAILSNKGMLALLWEMAPNHPNLLPAFFEDDPKAATLAEGYARKPLYSREGANVSLVRAGAVVDADEGPYGVEGFVRQALAIAPNMDGNYPVFGSWVIGGKACGLGVREDSSPITKNTSRFVPHAILG